jgi:serine/threonine protein kinase
MSDPQRIGPYRITSRLGSGGMGWVYLGRSPSGRAVAVKVVRPEFADDPQFRQRFAREVSAARAVSGAFTAAVVDADPEADPPWLATVYIPGPSLWEAVQMHGPLPESQVRLLGVGLVEALQAIHAAQLVHRDLKPANVLLAEDGPRVIDFGISRGDGLVTITRPGAIIGTPSYMSPEQVRGEQTGPASDVFALGAVLAFAATGAPPFGETGIEVVLARVLQEAPVLDRLSGELSGVLTWCMSKDPGIRPSLDVLLRAFLDPLEQDESIVPWPEDVAESIRVRAAEAKALPSREGAAAPRSLLLHAQALLAAGLTDRMVIEAVSGGRR